MYNCGWETFFGTKRLKIIKKIEEQQLFRKRLGGALSLDLCKQIVKKEKEK